ncbi:MAG: hypothetical protein NVSMB5_20890 [Candidatus Velthaea sp.]
MSTCGAELTIAGATVVAPLVSESESEIVTGEFVLSTTVFAPRGMIMLPASKAVTATIALAGTPLTNDVGAIATWRAFTMACIESVTGLLVFARTLIVPDPIDKAVPVASALANERTSSRTEPAGSAREMRQVRPFVSAVHPA